MSTRNRFAKLFENCLEKHFPKGEVIIRPTDVVENLFYIVSGQVKQYEITDNGDRLIVHTYSAGTVFPIERLTSDSESEYFYEVSTDSQLKYKSIVEVVAQIEGDHELLINALRQSSRQAKDTDHRLVNLMTGDAKQKVVFELIRSCKLYGDKREDGSYFIKIHEEDIAVQLGITRETVNRALKKLDTTLVHVTHSGIEISDLDKLISLNNT